jgi:anaerobic selenocysteine-containing dehydrogenase
VLGDSTPIAWPTMQSTGRIREALAEIVAGYEEIGEIDATKMEFRISGRVFHEPKFPTPSGRARLHISELPELAGGDGQLRLMTVRSEGQFNTVVYEDYDLYRAQDRRDVILINPADVERLGLKADQRVTVESEVGSLPNILVRPFDEIKAGNALMYYPEANALVPRKLDPLSKTPAFKNVLVTLAPSPAGAATAVKQPVLELASQSAERKPLKSC